ncbi:MAG: arginine repressor [Spirochaetia bacterium]
MKERTSRLKTIKAIIKKERVDSQESLLQHLKSLGYQVTQATLSRDLKLLKVGKVADGYHGYYYTLPGDDETKENERIYKQDFVRGYVSLAFSGNLGLLKTLPGHADSVALALDNLDFEHILGTVAGDDAVLVILKEDKPRDEFYKILKEKIPEVEL